jgi:hypothetical protein
MMYLKVDESASGRGDNCLSTFSKRRVPVADNVVEYAVKLTPSHPSWGIRVLK